MNDRIRELIVSSDAVPSVPQIVTRFLEITGSDTYDIQEVVNLLSTDPGIAADVLRLANSPLFGVTRKVGSLIQASNLLGVRRIRTLVLGRCMVDRISRAKNPLIDTSYYWRRSLGTGVLSARFADQLVPGCREEAFMSGLLSDVGVVVMSQAFPETYGPAAGAYAPRQGENLIEEEFKAVGIAHPEVSAMVLERWSLPESMALCVRHHHTTPPASLPKEVKSLVRIVTGASEIARMLCEAPGSEAIASACDQAMHCVGLSLTVLQHVLREIESDVSEFASILHIDVIPSRVYDLIANSIAEQLNVPA